MDTGRSTLTIIACLCLLMVTERMVKQAFGGQRTTKDQAASASSAKGNASTAHRTKVVSAPKAIEGAARHDVQRRSMTPAKSAVFASKETPSKKHRAVKFQKKVIPKPVVQPRIDLIHYGVLEDSLRYDPRPHAAPAGVPSPQTPELIHDHFQELDRNQDGMIDPVERAFGRIDMDRDLHTRALQ
jgi:hypothetical protein